MKRGKYSDWTRGQVEALLNIIGEENAKKLLRGEIKPSFKKAVESLFNKHGRRIPPKRLYAAVCEPNRDYYLDELELKTETDYRDRIERLHKYLGPDTGGVGASYFMAETERLVERIWHNPQIANLLCSVWLPVVLPKLTTDDIGRILEQYLEAAAKSYTETFKGRRRFITSYLGMSASRLTGRVKIVEGSRHDQLIELMRQGPVIGIYFPNSLQGFSPKAAIKQMASLPEGFILSGLDAVIAMLIYPDVLARPSSHSIDIHLAALSWMPDKDLLCFSGDIDLVFGESGRLDAFELCTPFSSAGLLFIR